MSKGKTASEWLVDGSKNTEKILETANEQSKIANRQFWISLFITSVALIIGLIPLLTNQNKVVIESIDEIKNDQFVTKEELLNRLDSLQIRVKSLENQLDGISKKGDSLN